MVAQSTDDLIGRELDGRYRLEARLGEGGLGVVYRARHKRLNRSFAVKVLQPAYAENEALRARFEREAQALGALTHPGVVGVTDFGIDGAVPYLVMELLEGQTLDAAMPLPLDRGLSVVRDVLGAVAYAHGVNLVHRDLKPANVFLERLPEGQERVRVLDFGLAKFVDGEGGATLTRPGATLGTPAYMPPEQALGGAASARNDVYALGILLYELITGERPFRGEPSEVMRQHLLVPVPALCANEAIGLAPDLTTALDGIVQRATAKAPAERFADASEMRAALDRAMGRSSGAYAASVSGSGQVPVIRAPEPMRTPPPRSPSSDDVATRAPLHRAGSATSSDGASPGGSTSSNGPSVPGSSVPGSAPRAGSTSALRRCSPRASAPRARRPRRLRRRSPFPRRARPRTRRRRG